MRTQHYVRTVGVCLDHGWAYKCMKNPSFGSHIDYRKYTTKTLRITVYIQSKPQKRGKRLRCQSAPRALASAPGCVARQSSARTLICTSAVRPSITHNDAVAATQATDARQRRVTTPWAGRVECGRRWSGARPGAMEGYIDGSLRLVRCASSLDTSRALDGLSE